METLPVVFKAVYHGRTIPYVLINGEPWWVASYVCKTLGYSTVTHALRVLRPSQRGMYLMAAEGSISRKKAIISESGLYRLMIRSNKKEAVEFQEWLEDEVLPQLRKTGQYIFPQDERELARLAHRPNQVSASKEINNKLGNEGGKWEVIAYNQDITVALSRNGLTPKELRELGKELGLPSRHTNSGAEVIRCLEPERAMAMCMEKEWIAEGADPDIARQGALELMPHFLAFHNVRMRILMSRTAQQQLV